mgnify:CR=1 FL=1
MRQLEERAERGTPRGAANLWAEVQLEAGRGSRGSASHRSRIGREATYRIAIGVLTVAVLGVLVASLVVPPRGQTIESPAGRGGDTEVTPSGEPARILVDGMGLRVLHPPVDPNRENSGFDLEETATWRIFADPDRPFEGPIVGVEILDGGGFRPWGVNLAERSLSDFTDGLTRDGEVWSMASASGLRQVAAFTAPRFDTPVGWQADFEDEAQAVTWQAETHEGAGIWVWLVRVLGQDTSGSTARPLEVVGRPGVVVTPGEAGVEEVMWADETFVYRLTAADIAGNTSLQIDAGDLVGRLGVADEDTWSQAVSASGRTSTPDLLLSRLTGFLTVVLAVAALAFLIRGPRILVLIGPLAVFLWMLFGPTSSVLAVLLLGLYAGSWIHRRRIGGRRATGEPRSGTAVDG